MSPHRPLTIRALCAALLSASLLSGCAAFQGSRKVDVTPFSENTVGMLGEMQKFNRPVSWVYLRKYQNLPSVDAARRGIQPLRDLLRGVGLYSTQVVALYDSPLSEDRKISELARYMTDYIRPSLAEADTGLGFSAGDLDKVVASIRSSKTFLSALSAAQPLVNATVARGNELFDSLDGLTLAAGADISGRIEQQFAPLKRSAFELDDLNIASNHSYALIENYRNGDAAALDSLRASDGAAAALLPGKAPSSKDLDAAERFVVDRSDNLRTLRAQLDPQMEIYRQSIAELEDLRIQTDERAKLGRMTLLLWGRSHRNLASGISVKPMIDVMGIMKSTATTATKGILP